MLCLCIPISLYAFEHLMFFAAGVMIQIHVVDLNDQMIHEGRLLRIQPSATIEELKQLVSTTFDLCVDSMTIVLDRGFTDFFPLSKSRRTLSEEGFGKVNRVTKLFLSFRNSGSMNYYTCTHTQTHTLAHTFLIGLHNYI